MPLAGFRQGVLVRHHQGHAVGLLVVVEHAGVHPLGGFGEVVLEAFGGVFLTVGGDEEALESAHDIEEVRVFGADVAHVAGVEPAVNNGIGRGLGVLPVAGHHVFSADDNLAFGAVGYFLAIGVQDDAVHGLDDAAGGTEAGVALRVGADDGRGFREAVALEHGHAHGAEEALQLDVQQGAAAHEEAHAAAEALAHLGEHQFVKQVHQRLAPGGAAGSAVVVFLVVFDGIAQGKVEELLREAAFLLDGALDVLLEVAGQGRNGKHHVRTHLRDGHGHVTQRCQGVFADGDEGDGTAVNHHGVHAGHMGEAVVQREDDEHDLSFVDADDGVALLHVGGVVAVGEEDALGVGRGAGGVGDVGIVVRADGFVPGLELVPVGLQELVTHLLDFAHADFLGLQAVVVEGGVVKDDDLFHGGAFRQDGADLGQVVAGDQNPLGFGMVDAEHQVFPFSQVHGEGNVGGAGVHGTQFGENPHGAALGQEGNLVSLLEAQGHEAGADAVGHLTGLALGDFFPVSVHLFAEVGMVLVLAGVLLYEVDDGYSFCHNVLF